METTSFPLDGPLCGKCDRPLKFHPRLVLRPDAFKKEETP